MEGATTRLGVHSRDTEIIPLSGGAACYIIYCRVVDNILWVVIVKLFVHYYRGIEQRGVFHIQFSEDRCDVAILTSPSIGNSDSKVLQFLCCVDKCVFVVPI